MRSKKQNKLKKQNKPETKVKRKYNPHWTYREQIGLLRTYLDAVDKTFVINLGELGPPIQYIRESLGEIESYVEGEIDHMKKGATRGFKNSSTGPRLTRSGP